jgi:uncharacterized RDD family membrane protein YckC
MKHTFSFWRRVGALAIDFVLAHLVIVVLFGWFASSLDSPMRFKGSLLIFSRCADAHLTSDGKPVENDYWDKIQICDVSSDFFFPHRELKLQKTTKEGAVQYTYESTLELDKNNKGTYKFPLDSLIVFSWLFLAVAFESSRWQATPGKRIFGLEVVSPVSGRLTVLQSCQRNLLKSAGAIFYGVYTYLAYFVMKDEMLQYYQVGGSEPVLPDWLNFTVLYVLYPVLAVQTIVVLSIFWWIGGFGKGIYDRIAGTQVVRA